MREAIGATWIFVIVIVFIIVFTGYLAFSVNYAKAFAVKDTIIDTLEKFNGPGSENDKYAFSSSGPVLDEIKRKMKNINYNSKGRCSLVAKSLVKSDTYNQDEFKNSVMGVTGNVGYVMDNPFTNRYDTKDSNYCVIRLKQHGHNSYGDDYSSDSTALALSSYFVATFFSIDIDIINMISVHFNFFVSGQTKNIAYPNDEFLSVS